MQSARSAQANQAAGVTALPAPPARYGSGTKSAAVSPVTPQTVSERPSGRAEPWNPARSITVEVLPTPR